MGRWLSSHQVTGLKSTAPALVAGTKPASHRVPLGMLFNSEPYLFFLPIVVVSTWLTPARFRPAVLVLASYYFYSFWSVPFLLLIGGLTAANYLIGLRQSRSE